ncbi:MAG: rhodanese-like domain-containing protein [Deltaproteobacteria bacterium]|nr:rhodanese-like domain-containing protein [Deltaproteobacteria bacterium]
MALSDLDDNIDNLPKDQMIVNVCYTGQNASFATAVINLIGLDPAYTGLEARNLKFGMCSVSTDGSLPETDKWISAVAEDEFAESLEQTANTVDTVQEYPNPGTGATTLAGIIKANLDAAASGWNLKAADVFSAPDNYFVINYWPEDQYLNPGHVPGAYQFSPKSSLKTDGKLNLLPADETVVIYCYTGQTSAQVTAYLRLLGYDAKSLLYGVNGFAFNLCPGTKYHEPENDYSSIVE